MYPKLFFGSLMTIITENEPITQDRIMELTGVSRGYVSLILKQLQMNVPIKSIKRPGSRKKFFAYESNPTSYILDLLFSRIIHPDFDLSRLLEIASGLAELDMSESHAKNFSDFVQNMLIHEQIQKEVRQITHSELSKVFEIGEIPKKLLSFKISKKLVSFISSLGDRRKCNEEDLGRQKIHSNKYSELKNVYFQTFRETLNPMFRAEVSNWSLVLHEVLIEGCSSQDSIKKSTHLPQSTISESLNLLIHNGYIAKIRIDGYREVFYYPKESLTSLILRRFERLDGYSSSVLSILDDTINSIKTQKNREVNNFKSVLLEIKKGYKILQQYSNRMRYISMKKIYDKHKEGFHFI